jgi:hypothetical protein
MGVINEKELTIFYLFFSLFNGHIKIILFLTPSIFEHVYDETRFSFLYVKSILYFIYLLPFTLNIYNATNKIQYEIFAE